MESGSIIVDEIERQMRLTGSLIIVYDDSFFNDAMAKFTIEVGKQIQLGNQYFKLIVLEVKPILAEHLRFFKSFSRITVKKHYEERAYQQILKILTGTDLTENDLEVENRRLKDRNEQIAFSRLVNLQPPQKLFSECRKGIDLYKRLVETKSEELYYIRLVVLGQEGVGKTSLVRRLLQESISQVKSTNGIEINVNKYGISLRTGEWQFHKVSNISKGLDQNELQETVLYERKPKRKQILSEVQDYVQYWTNTVHCYGDISRNKDQFLNPPIIPVATHVDKIQLSNVQEYIEDYREALVKSLGSDRQKDHLRNFFAISNTQSSEDEMEKLRQYIFAIA
ncbi:unnamed protein product [Mytilus edulis]|uniref:Roc domain-containing protein n=1 Tax=Mytilus edulis TaxID=6550 RepID=A0A8S3UUK1_MYTED|nr:unnamed protein product [Mytilus edulis]